MNPRGNRTRRRHLLLSVLVAAGLVALTAAPSPEPVQAAWTDPEIGTGALTAGIVNPVQNLSCGLLGLGQVRLNWAQPVEGPGFIDTHHYHWVASNGITGSGDVAGDKSTTTVNITHSMLLATGTGRISIYAVSAGGWTSVARTATVTVIIGVLGICSTP